MTVVVPGSVLVAYPHPPGPVEHSWHVALTALVNHDAAHHQRTMSHRDAGPLQMRCGTGGLVTARNDMMRHLLDQSDAEWLWMVDTDMGFRPDTLDRLALAADPVERPVVGALTFMMRYEEPDGYGGFRTMPAPVIYGWERGDSGDAGFRQASEYPRDTLIRVAGTGAACLLVHRDAAGKVRAEHGDDWFTPVRYPDGRFVSEDLSFCYRLGSLGIPLHVHTGIRTTHAKQVWIGERDYLEHRALMDLVEVPDDG